MVIFTGTLHHLDISSCLDSLCRILNKSAAILFFEPLGTNPIINLFRYLTPTLRSPDEHPLVSSDFSLMRQYFSDISIERHCLTTFLVMPLSFFGDNAMIRSIARSLGKLDQFLSRVPLFKPFYWIVIVKATA